MIGINKKGRKKKPLRQQILSIRHTVSHSTTILSMSDIPLHWVQQLHVSALGIGHHQVVLRLMEQLYNKQGIRGE
jgi:hypothetical protein